MSDKIVSQKVVSSKVVEKKGYLGEKFGNLGESISAFCMAPILILLAIGLLFYSEGFHKSSEVVGKLPVETAAEVAGESGLHKIADKVTLVTPVKAPEMGDVLYYSYVKQTFDEVEETSTDTVTRVEDGKEIEDTVETTKLVEKWVDNETKEPSWAKFKLGEFGVVPDGASLKLDLQKVEYWYDEPTARYKRLNQGENRVPKLKDQRMIVSFLPVDSKLVVVGEVNGQQINKGAEFIISNQSPEALQNSLETEESVWFWVLKFVVWLLLVIGMTSIIGPIIALVDFIPLFGRAAKAAAGFLAAIIALVIVLIGSILIRYWWLFLILTVVVIVGLVVLLIVLMRKQKKSP